MHCRITLEACGTTEWHKFTPIFIVILWSTPNLRRSRKLELQTANVIGGLTANLGKTLIEKYSEIDNTEIFLK